MEKNNSEMTMIRISKKTWKKLNGLKKYPNMTFDEIIEKLVDRELKK
jgi:hypothetical protein